ncbi:YDG domain-containing protein [uncultured Sphaerochaeta sp.]|uniref:beta strand repeat-containing protein n=1 Tax=uncultured Sphaerochaeta sp. TaxID=886478 RepID=UPI002A0A7307|nr:YDG domain-containing protein [uncultured Sphaerochaeta sp.]
MQNINKKYIVILVLLVSSVLFLVGCSDMMAKLGNITLHVVLEDTPKVSVATYKVEGTLANSNETFVRDDVTSLNVDLSSLKPGNWTISVTAYDADKNQIGMGHQEITLNEGEILETSISVTFTLSAPDSALFFIYAPERYDSAIGKVTGTTAEMEYKLTSADDDAYVACSEGETLLAPGNYMIRYAAQHSFDANGTLSITIPAYQSIQLTIGTPTGLTKEYDGTTTAFITSGTLIGIQGTDTVSVSASASYDSATAGTDKIITVIYTLSGVDKDNYLKPVDGTITGVIEKKQLTVSGTTITPSKVYDGSPTATVTSDGTFNGMITGHTVTVTASANYNDKSAGTGKPITVSYTLNGTDASNYLKPVDNSTFTGTITTKSLSVSGTELATSKPYDGSNTATVTSNGTLNGLITGDTVTVAATATYADKTIGTAKSINVQYTLGGLDAANYGTPGNNTSFTAAIDRKQLTVTGSALTESKGYDGNATATISAGSLSGKVSTEDVSVSATATYDNKSVGTGKTITVSYTLNGADKDNYLKPVDTTIRTGIIEKKQLTVSGTAITPSKEYDSSTTATVTSDGTLNGVVTGETVTVAATATYDNKSVGTGKTIAVSYTLSGVDKDNYLKPVDGTITGVIEKKQLTVSGTTITPSKVYDGSTTIAVTSNGTLNGIITGESVALSGVLATYSSSTAGENKAVTVSYTLSGNDSGNYIINNDESKTATITKKALVATVEDSSKTYGEANPTFTVSVNGFVNNESASTASGYGAPIASSTATSATGVGSYAITITGGSADNYSFNVNDTGILTIGKKTLTVTATAAGKVYDGTSGTTGSLALAGVIGSDSVSATGTYAFTDANAGNSKTVNVSGITLAGAQASNYSLSSTTATTTATITKATMTGSVSISGTAKYGEVLTAVPNLTNAGTPTYQWKRGGVAISGATGTTYTLVTADIGSAITVTATADGVNFTGSITSSSTATVVKTAGPAALSDNISAYYPTSLSDQDIINLVSFTANTTGLEAAVALSGTTYGAYADLPVDSRGRAKINLSSDASANTKVKIRVKETPTAYAGSDKLLSVTSQALAVGDYYQGGLVGYFFTSSNTGYVNGQLHGLLVAEVDLNSSHGIKWSDDMTTTIGTGTAIGTGSTNTTKIISSLGASASSYAAGIARAYDGGGYSDWFLPSWDELKKLRDSRNTLGTFNDGSVYWCSSESTQSGYSAAKNAHGVTFASYDPNWVYSKDYTMLSRAVRNF